MPITRLVATLLFTVVVAAMSIAVVCTYVIPLIHYLFATVAKSLLMALAGA